MNSSPIWQLVSLVQGEKKELNAIELQLSSIEDWKDSSPWNECVIPATLDLDLDIRVQLISPLIVKNRMGHEAL
jgi:hypothetical protein